MKKVIKLVATLIICFSFLAVFSGCTDNAIDEVYFVANSFVYSVFHKDSTYISSVTEFEKEELVDMFNIDPIHNAIIKNVSYEVIESTLKASSRSKTGSAQVVLHIPDYNSVFEARQYTSIPELIHNISQADTYEVSVELSVIKQNGEWMVENPEVLLDNVFLDICNSDVSEIIELYEYEYVWYGADSVDGTEAYFVNTESLDVDINLDEKKIVYYTVEFDGEVLFESDKGTNEGYWNESTGAVLNEYGLLDEGDYVITFHIGNIPLCTFVAHVSVDESLIVTNYGEFEASDFAPKWYGAADVIGPYAIYNNTRVIDMDLNYIGDGNWDYYYDNIYYKVKVNNHLAYTSGDREFEGIWNETRGASTTDDGFLIPGLYCVEFYQDDTVICQGYAFVTATDYYEIEKPFTDAFVIFSSMSFRNNVIDCRWYDPDYHYSMSSYNYESEVSYVSYSIEVNEDFNTEIYYAYYYLEDNVLDMESPVYSAAITPTTYDDGTYYDINCNQGEDGTYVLVVASDADMQHVILTTFCRVG